MHCRTGNVSGGLTGPAHAGYFNKMGSVGLDDPGAEGVGRERPLTVGKYQLLAVLGRGGMADVYLALARGPAGFNKLAVVKRLRASLADDTSFRSMFLDEARLAARLNHPNVVHTYEVGAFDDVYFIAMEYLEGQSLNKVIKEGQKRGEDFDQLFCARIVSDALAGLHHAHELKDYDGTPLRIIHRDVSPHNIFVTYDGVVKVVDFGIAKAASSSVETEVGVIKGKVAYMSPEQAGGGRIDARADVFAMGIVLWELLTKQRLMAGDSAAATLHRLIMEPVAQVSTFRKDIDPELDAILTRSLEKDPARRFQTAQEMRDALDAYIARSRRTVRNDDIGRQITSMFQKVRDDIQRQVQEHMEAIALLPSTTNELPTLTDAALKTAAAASSRSQLPTLNVSSGSGSGVVANLAVPSPGFETFPPPPPAPTDPNAPAKKRGTTLWLMVGLGAVLIGLIAFRAGSNRAGSGDSSAAVAAATAPSPVQTTSFVDPPLVRGVTAPAAVDPRPAPTVDIPPPPAVVLPPQGPAHVTRNPGPKHVLPQKPPSTSAPPPPPAAGSDDQGYLTFDTYPWTKVTENGRVLGTTPLVHVALPAGAHTLTLENPEQGIKQSYSVTIKAGDTSSHRLGLK
jgi:serine/threonine protein kinase